MSVFWWYLHTYSCSLVNFIRKKLEFVSLLFHLLCLYFSQRTGESMDKLQPSTSFGFAGTSKNTAATTKPTEAEHTEFRLGNNVGPSSSWFPMLHRNSSAK